MNHQKSTTGSCLFLIGAFILGIVGVHELMALFLSGGEKSLLAIGIFFVAVGAMFQLNKIVRAEYEKEKEKAENDQ